MSPNVDWPKIMPDAWRVFFRFRTPRIAQAAAMPQIIQGVCTLISSPTASGKTEAVFAPLYQRHVSFCRPDLSVIYVAPTKALVNDMYARLSEYFSGASGDIVQRYTGDHHEFSSALGKFALLCTPEALDSLQLVRPELLHRVRAVIVDELHLLHGTGRGQQLRSVLARIRTQAKPPKDERDQLQTVAMTATLQDQQAVADLWLGEGAAIIDVGEPRPIHMQYIHTENSGVAASIVQELQNNPKDKVLLFANTRNQAHELAAKLYRLLMPTGWPVYLHIGLLASGERESIEYAMKHERRGICVATSTLEVGIDIGDIDVVVLCQPPRTVSGFLQRIGRGNRRSGDCCVWAIVHDQKDEAVYRALFELGSKGVLDDVHEYHRFSVDIQQLISLAWIGLKRDDPLTVSNCLERSGFAVTQDTVSDMLATGVLNDVRGALIPNDEWVDLADRRQIHSVIIGGAGVPIIDTHSGETIGTADESLSGRVFFAGTRMRRATDQDGSGVYVQTLSHYPLNLELAKLPMGPGGRKGQSRQLVWALAEQSGTEPRIWVRNVRELITYGGDDYNLLLEFLMTRRGIAGKLTHNSIAITGLANSTVITPAIVSEWAGEFFQAGQIPFTIARKFREATSFTGHLSAGLSRREAKASVPIAGFMRWLSECSPVESLGSKQS